MLVIKKLGLRSIYNAYLALKIFSQETKAQQK